MAATKRQRSAYKSKQLAEAQVLFVGAELPIREVARRVGVTTGTVQAWRWKFGWDDLLADKRNRVAEKMIASASNDEAREKQRALAALRTVRDVALDSIVRGHLDDHGQPVPPLRPRKFQEAGPAPVGAVREEAELSGWKPQPAQIINIVVGERMQAAAEVVKVAVDILIGAIPEPERAKAIAVFNSRLDELEEQFNEPPVLGGGSRYANGAPTIPASAGRQVIEVGGNRHRVENPNIAGLVGPNGAGSNGRGTL